ncbi:uncharacterized protein LOC128892242 [Hylaeus anthracinus]|uniref:uncharacterized protein LOC128892242 n=1 Tax=Hylaeus anthracinus TaxID=313031 RepID=UPI0023B8BD0D|nr:uncharacterized protein LOC128892242 [Hylaeus anthracinus]XP_054008487.1 uncharacterized protein LOC128892242 [Hylaeus anthracinus]XP_054008488.1 uncharacterized protein LOC128892242 [Hylaeus anthracinus]
METEEIYSLTLAPPVISRFAVQWSQDNHVSIITEKGIHILELIPTPTSPHSIIKFSRSFVYSPTTYPTEVVINKVESKIWNMDREDLYSFLIEESLTPKMSNVKDMIPKIVDLTWSPENLIHPGKCCLGILTSTGACTVIHKISTDWYPAHDLSSIRYRAVENEINTKLENINGNNDSCLTIKDCINMLYASCMTWSILFVDHAYLSVAYRNGDIVIYKIFKISDCDKIPEPKIAGTIRLNENVKINALHWITINTEEHMIIVGYFDGRIYGLRIKSHNEVVELESVDKYYDYADRIPVSAIRTFPRVNSIIKVLISKGTFVFLLHFTMKRTLMSIENVQLEGFMISGVTCISADYALVTTENSSMFGIDTQENKLSKIEVKNGLQQAHVRYLGLAHSLSYVIFVNVTSPNSLYDHLILKEPSKICMFGLKGEHWDPSFIINKSEGVKFEQLWDCLEVIRMKATKAAEPSTVLPKVPSNLECLSLHELRIAMWVSVIIEICEKKKVIQGIGSIAGEISEVQPLIFVHTACNYLECLVNKSSLLEEEKLSVNLLRMYLEVYLAGEENEEPTLLSKRVKDVLQKLSQFSSIGVETCNLCGEIINDLSWKVTKCLQGHILPRCAITLLQITTVRYRMCHVCDLIFHPCLDHEFEETRCLFCDIPVLQDNRVLSSKSFVSIEKSLSRPQNFIFETLEDRETEVIADES